MLTELEHIVLGVVHLEQPCTAYAVKAVFARSLSSHWSGSAGAIYPAIRRLEARRLIRSVKRAGDGRSTREYRLTRTGTRDLRAWLKPPLPDGAALMGYDPLRARFRFIGLLKKGDALQSIAEARARMTHQLEQIQSEADRVGRSDPFLALSHRGAILATRAQLAWLTEAMKTIAELGD